MCSNFWGAGAPQKFARLPQALRNVFKFFGARERPTKFGKLPHAIIRGGSGGAEPSPRNPENQSFFFGGDVILIWIDECFLGSDSASLAPVSADLRSDWRPLFVRSRFSIFACSIFDRFGEPA